jgi:small subunit ribosomal protein S2
VAQVGIKELLEAGVHFGHQTRRWNPKMRRFIFGERGGIHIIDLQQTEKLLQNAQNFAAEVASRGGTVLFVGTKKQARDAVRDAATNAGMPYVNQRWLGGLLTNFQTLNKRIRRLHQLTEWTEDGTLELLPTRERIGAINEREKLEINLGGVRNMQRTPDAVFVVDLKTEVIAVREAERLRIPIIGLVDTNVDPDPVTYPIPGNDDAIRSCKLIVEAIGDVVADRAAQFRAEEEAARREREEQERREAEERARREQEERERQEAQERARQEAAAAQAAEQAARQAQQAQAQAQETPPAQQEAAPPQQEAAPAQQEAAPPAEEPPPAAPAAEQQSDQVQEEVKR